MSRRGRSRSDDKAAKLLTPEARRLLGALWSTRLRQRRMAAGSASKSDVRAFADAKGVKLGAVAQPLRAALTGSPPRPASSRSWRCSAATRALARIADAAESSTASASRTCDGLLIAREQAYFRH